MRKSVVNVILIVIAIILVVLTIIMIAMVNESGGLSNNSRDSVPSGVATDTAVASFNSTFANYTGTVKGSLIKTLLQELSTNNEEQENTDEHFVEVTFIDEEENYLLENETDATSIYECISNVYSSNKYKVTVIDVDSEGYYSAIKIEAVSNYEKTNNSTN